MRWSSLTLREGLVLIEANFKTGSLRKKRPTFPNAATDFPPSPPSIALRHDITGTSPEISDQTSALVLVENLLHPSLFFYDISTIRVARFCTRSIFAFKEYWFGDHTWVACLTWDFTRNRQSVRLTLTSVMRGQAHFRGPRSLLALATIVSCACLACVASAWRYLDERKNRRARGRHARPVLSCVH